MSHGMKSSLRLLRFVLVVNSFRAGLQEGKGVGGAECVMHEYVSNSLMSAQVHVAAACVRISVPGMARRMYHQVAFHTSHCTPAAFPSPPSP
jgi:hypothetical protein